MLFCAYICTHTNCMIDVKIKKSSNESQVVLGAVYEPCVEDTQHDFMKADAIEKMAYDFMRSEQLHKIDIHHDNKLYGCCVVESFIARKEDTDFSEGSWVIGVHVPNSDIWQAIKSGEINGFSMEALVTRAKADFNLPVILKGHSEKADYGQSESITVFIDKNGSITGDIPCSFILDEIVEL